MRPYNTLPLMSTLMSISVAVKDFCIRRSHSHRPPPGTNIPLQKTLGAGTDHDAAVFARDPASVDGIPAGGGASREKRTGAGGGEAGAGKLARRVGGQGGGREDPCLEVRAGERGQWMEQESQEKRKEQGIQEKLVVDSSIPCLFHCVPFPHPQLFFRLLPHRRRHDNGRHTAAPTRTPLTGVTHCPLARFRTTR